MEDKYYTQKGRPESKGALIPQDAGESCGQLVTCLADHKPVWDAIPYVVSFREWGKRVTLSVVAAMPLPMLYAMG